MCGVMATHPTVISQTTEVLERVLSRGSGRLGQNRTPTHQSGTLYTDSQADQTEARQHESICMTPQQTGDNRKSASHTGLAYTQNKDASEEIPVPLSLMINRAQYSQNSHRQGLNDRSSQAEYTHLQYNKCPSNYPRRP